jgi:hypothetical protein
LFFIVGAVLMMELDVAERNETGYSVNKVCCCSELSFLWKHSFSLWTNLLAREEERMQRCDGGQKLGSGGEHLVQVRTLL